MSACYALLSCLCLFLLCGEIIYLVWGSIILHENIGATTTCNQVWIYCLVSIIISGIYFVFAFYTKRDESNPFKILAQILAIGMLIWSCVIYGMVTNDDTCKHIYDEKYPDLWLFFSVVFWINIGVASFCIIFVIVTACCLSAANVVIPIQ